MVVVVGCTPSAGRMFLQRKKKELWVSLNTVMAWGILNGVGSWRGLAGRPFLSGGGGGSSNHCSSCDAQVEQSSFTMQQLEGVEAVDVSNIQA